MIYDELASESEIKRFAQPVVRECGVYFLLDDDEIVYVGQSTDIEARISVHYNQKKKRFNRYTYLSCSAEYLNDIEAHYIVHLAPKYNVKLPENSRWATVKDIKNRYGIAVPKIRKYITEHGIEHVNQYYKWEDFSLLAEV